MRGTSVLGTYLEFDGDCAPAVELYKAALRAEVLELRTYGDVPNPGFEVAEAEKQLVLHARLRIEGDEVMCSDTTTHATRGDMQYVTITTADEDFVRQAWSGLAAGGRVFMELQPTFFAAAHGSLQDRFGVNWMFTALPDESTTQIEGNQHGDE